MNFAVPGVAGSWLCLAMTAFIGILLLSTSLWNKTLAMLSGLGRLPNVILLGFIIDILLLSTLLPSFWIICGKKRFGRMHGILIGRGRGPVPGGLGDFAGQWLARLGGDPGPPLSWRLGVGPAAGSPHGSSGRPGLLSLGRRPLNLSNPFGRWPGNKVIVDYCEYC